MSTLNLYTPHKLTSVEIKEFVIEQIQNVYSELDSNLDVYDDELIELMEYSFSNEIDLDTQYKIDSINDNIEEIKEDLDDIDHILYEISENQIKLTQEFAPEEISASNKSESEIKKMLQQGYLYEINLFNEPLFIKYRYQITVKSKHDLSIIESYL